MKQRLLSVVCALAILLGMITVPTFAETESATGAAVCGEKNYSSLQAAVDDYTFGIIVLQEDAQNVDIPHNVHLDLNGHNVAGITVTDGVTLYIADSQTDDYTVADGVCGAVTGITGSVQAAEGYLAITEDEAVSFHRVDLSIKSMSLRPGVAGVYYTSNFAADEIVAAQVESYGVALSVAAEPNAENLETLCGYSVLYDFGAGEKSGTLLTGIMDEANDAETNAAYAAMDIYGRAYIKTEDGYTFGAVAVRDLQEQVEAIDAVFENLTETQKAGILAMYEAYKAAMADWNIPNLRGNQLGDTVITVPVKTENGVVTEEITVEENGMSITIPFGALVEATQLTLTVTKLDASESDIEANEGQTLMPFDVHVEGVSPENTVPLTVYLGKVMPENLNMGNYSIYHVEADGTKEMTLVANDEAFAAHNQYKYTLDGELTLHMATFSVVAVLSENGNAWNGNRDYTWYNAEAEELYIRNADQLAGLGAIVGGMDGQTQDSFQNKTVKLLSDISIGDMDGDNMLVFYPIGYYNNTGSYEKQSGNVGPDGAAVVSGYKNFEGTFNGNGHTISDFYQNTWEMFGDYNDGYSGTPNHNRDGMGLFGRIYGGTVKNLNVMNFSSDGEFATTGTIAAYADCAATFENIAIFNCNPRVYNIGNGGIVGCVGWYAKTDVEEPVTFRNITVDNSNKISALWGSWDVACGGLVGQYYPTSGQSTATKNKGVHFENCHAAAQIDVYNDVCANYQYYAYRYSGMMIGSIRENVTVDGYVYPKMDGITAVNCTVHFGDWNDYYYCELVDNTLASYTHDHQMSRLEQVASVDAESKQVTTLKGETVAIPTSGRANYVVVKQSNENGFIHGDGDEFAECYHFLNGEVWTHDMGGIDKGIDENGDGQDDLKEDKQHIYREFNQLFTGYGWGVTSKGLEDVKDLGLDVVVLDRLPASTVKFNDILNKTLAQKKENLVIAENTVLTAGQIFKAAATDIQGDKVQIFVSPADENSTVEPVSYVSTGTEWAAGTLQFKGEGKATVTITDYYFCEPTVVTVTVGSVKAAADAMDFSAGGTVNGLCPACAFLAGNAAEPEATATVDWTAMAAAGATYMDGAHKHFYLDKDANYTKLTGFIRFNENTSTTDEIPNNTGTPGCINLNGQNITSTARMFLAYGADTVLNIMGSGKVTGGTATCPASTNYTGAALDIAAKANLFGGTYTSTTAFPVVSAYGTTNPVVNIYEGTVIERAAGATKGRNLYISDKGTVNMYGGVIRGGTAVNPDSNLSAIVGYGGNVIINCPSAGYTLAFNLYGGEVCGGTAAEKGGNFAVYKSDTARAIASVNLAGGSVTGGSVYLGASNETLKLTGTPVVSEIELAGGALADVSGLSLDAQPIKVVCDDQVKFTEAISENAAAYEAVFYVDDARKTVAAEDSQLMVDDLCPHCDKALCKLEWTPLTDTATLGKTKQHYRVTKDITKTSGNYILRAIVTEVIVDTNGFDLTNSYRRCLLVDSACEAYFFDSKGGTELSGAWDGGDGAVLYSSGTAHIYDVTMTASIKALYAISGAADSVINIYSGTVNPATGEGTSKIARNINVPGTLNIYGGTFHPATDAQRRAVYTHGGTVSISGGTFLGIVERSSTGTVNLSGDPVISQVVLPTGKVLNVGEMTDGASVTVNAANDTVVSSAITTENADTYGKYFHALDETLDVTVVTQESGDKVLQVVDDFCVHCGVSVGDIQWIDLNDETVDALKLRCASTAEHYYLPTGHYKMTGDVSFQKQMMIGNYGGTASSDVVLDLNGYTLTLDEGVGSRVFDITNTGSKLTVLDSRPEATHEDDLDIPGGRIIGSRSGVSGGTLLVEAGTVVDMYGGTVMCADYAAPTEGGTVCCMGTFNLHGGKIIGCEVTNYGGTFYLSEGTLNVYNGIIEDGAAPGGMGSCIYTSGSAKLNIYGGTVNGEINYTANSQPQVTLSGAPTVTQLCIPEGKTITVNELTEGASIAVTATAAGVFTNAGAAQYQSYFYVYDAQAFTLVAEGDALALTENQVLYAGFNRTSVVPRDENGDVAYSVRLAGGNGTRTAEGCLDDITVSCIALKRGSETFLICTMDFLVANDEYVDPAKKAISVATGVPQSNILMHATHTHSGPYVASTSWTNGKQYRNDFYNWVSESAVAAINDLAVATASYGSTNANENMVFVRHYKQTHKLTGAVSYFGSNFGTGHFETGYRYIYNTEHTSAADREVQMIRFVRADKQDILLANLGAHATFNSSATSMSADFPHYFRTYVENTNSDIVCAYFIAAAGDQAPSTAIPDEKETAIKTAEIYGNTLGQLALAALNSLTAAQDGDILFSAKTVSAARNVPTSDEKTRANAVKAIWDESGKTSDAGKQAVTDYNFASIYQVESILSRSDLSEGAKGDIEIKTMAIGDLSFVFAPYEMFGQDGLAIKNGNAANHAMTFIITCGEGNEGYIPTDDGWNIGCYESHVTEYAKGTNTLLINEYLAMLAELKAEN